jgi:hypothetical protein
MTTPALVDRVAALRSEFLSVVALPDLSEKGSAENGVGISDTGRSRPAGRPEADASTDHEHAFVLMGVFAPKSTPD